MTFPCLISPDAPPPTLPGPPIRLGIMASGSGSNMAAIAQAIDSGELNAQIAGVIYNNPSALVARRAQERQIAATLLDHRQFDSRAALDQAIITALKDYAVDWVIMAGWMRRVTEVLIDAFPQRILNIHPSLLPSFPGVRAVEQSLNAGVKVTGCTVHYVELAVDSGPIVMQAAVPVRPDDTVSSLQGRIQVQEHRIFPAAIAWAAFNSLVTENLVTENLVTENLVTENP
ncbi:MAG: phosphoribosylglycinamide formyltransferase [Cyanobacteria bacterium P01_D01_bin.128]